jgi:hypothetical protein
MRFDFFLWLWRYESLLNAMVNADIAGYGLDLGFVLPKENFVDWLKGSFSFNNEDGWLGVGALGLSVSLYWPAKDEGYDISL